MWWECPKIQLFWTTATREIRKITKQVLDITPELALLNIFQDNNAHLHHKELITHLLSAARNTITRHWRDLSGVSMDQWYQIVWETALLEKLTNKLKLTQGQIDEDAFTPVWLPFITYTAQQVNDNNPPTAYKSICTAHDLPDNPSRFDWEPFVLGQERLASGRHWWEVEVEEATPQALRTSREPSVRRKGESRPNERQWELKENMEIWTVGAARESVVRKGKVSFNPNGGIWALGKALPDSLRTPLSPYRLTAFTSSERTILSLRYEPRKIRVYLDYEGGRVDFFDADTDDLIFTFPSASFSGERICPFFGVYWGVRLSLISLGARVISTVYKLHQGTRLLSPSSSNT
uniref:B30.2/SPRY domain-containing protein n=1 Tax=Podarcis muralis TaxID=64176 RepID=A0A670HX14_PODMU